MYYDSGDNWAPRIGATFDIFGDKRTKLTAFYGKYYLPIATNTNIRLGGSETYYLQDSATVPLSASIDMNGDGIPDTWSSMSSATSRTSSRPGAQICPAGRRTPATPAPASTSDGVRWARRTRWLPKA